MNNEEWVIDILRTSEAPQPTVPVYGARSVLKTIRRRRNTRVAGAAVAVAVLIAGPASYATIRSMGHHATRPSTAEVATQEAQKTTNPDSSAVVIPTDLVKQLGEGGYELAPPPVGAQPAVSATDAVAAAHDFVSADHPGVAVLYSVTTPDLGDLSDPADPQSKVIPLFDHATVWVVVFNVMVPQSAGGGYGAPTPDSNPLVPATVAVFVDATTGKAVRASLF